MDNTETDALINLGRHLFYERRLSLNEDRACGICHEQAKGFTDGFVRAVGTTGEIHPRNTLTLLNTSSRHRLGWLDQNLESVSEHMLIPLLGTDPVEMGMNGRIHQILETLSREAVYIALIDGLNRSEKRLGLELMQLALETFIMEIVTYDSPYDRFLKGETNAISAAAKRGADLFFSADMPCTGCHGGDDFDRRADGQHGWFNTGLYELGESRYPAGREGLFERTGRFDDIGRYRTPTLRHLALTAPYYHDGTGATLGDVLKKLQRRWPDHVFRTECGRRAHEPI